MRKGRGLELIVAQIKALKLPGATIKSPEYVDDIDTCTPREVDVGIHTTTENGEIFIAIECRDRGGTQDIQWIEQLISKKQSIGADLYIAVTSSHFTGPAIIKARKHGIAQTSQRNFDTDEIHKWLSETFIEIHAIERRFITGKLRLESGVQLSQLIGHYKFDIDQYQTNVGIQELLEFLIDDNWFLQVARRIPKEGQSIQLKASLDLSQNDTYIIVPPKLKVLEARLELAGVRRIEKIPLISGYSYFDSESKALVARGFQYGRQNSIGTYEFEDTTVQASNIVLDFRDLNPNEYVMDFFIMKCKDELSVQNISVNF